MRSLISSLRQTSAPIPNLPKLSVSTRNTILRSQNQTRFRRYVTLQAPLFPALPTCVSSVQRLKPRQPSTKSHWQTLFCKLVATGQVFLRRSCGRAFCGFAHDMIRAASLSTAPRGFAKALGPGLRLHKHFTPPLLLNFHTTFAKAYTPKTYIPIIHTRATYATMSSAASFFDFKPADSTSSLPPSSTLLLPHFPLSTHPLPSSTTLATYTNTPHQSAAPPTPSRTSPTKSSSSSTPPQNAASRPNSPAWRNSTKTSNPLTPTTSKSSASPATNSAHRTPAQTTRSKNSAK